MKIEQMSKTTMRFIDKVGKAIELDLAAIWEPYSKDNPLENTLAYLDQQARNYSIPNAVKELAIFEIFSAVKNGKLHPSTTKCSCGCGIDKSGTDFTHRILRRMLELNKELVIKHAKRLEERINREIKKKASKDFEKHIRQTKLGFWNRLWFELIRKR